LGLYPDVSLKVARQKRDEYRTFVADGIDPSIIRKAEKLTVGGQDSFEAVAREWHTKFSANWSKSHATKTIENLQNNIFPWLGAMPIKDIKPTELLAALRRIESRGAIYTARRVLGVCSSVFKYAITTGQAERNQAADLVGATPPTKTKHHAPITEPKEVGGLMRALQDYRGSFVTATALKLSPLVFVRPSELREAEWLGFDIDNAEWRVPAGRMKMGAFT